MPADAAKLVHRAAGAYNRPIAYRHMPAQRGSVADHRVVSHLRVVSHVNLRHQKIVIPDRSHHPSAFRSAMDGYELPDLVAIADAGLAALALIFQVLWSHANGGIRKEHVVRSYSELTFQIDVGLQHRALADGNIFADDHVGADFRR